MNSLIMLGTTQSGMQFLDDLLPESKEPRTFPIDYSEFVELGSGVRLGQGWLRCLWHWDILTETDRNTLYSYVGSVYIDTLDNDGTIQTCTALMVWPEKEPEHFNNRVIDLNIEFRQIVRV